MKFFFKLLLILDLLVVNTALGYFVYDSFFKPKEETLVSQKIQIPEEKVLDECGEECKKYIDQKIAESSLEKKTTPTPAKVITVPQALKTKSVSYVPIPGSGSTLANDWTTLSGTDFYLSKSDYPGLTTVYFEVNMKLMNGNGMAFVRLFDKTHGIGVSGSEAKTSNQTSTFVSVGPISVWEGYNQYQIQAKSLTADTTVFESGRLKIITEN